ncbi:MAG: MoxR family ATPase [Planctomycetes bacterium]|nr:MoxR family ATPase [Planctomycetota bacterium]
MIEEIGKVIIGQRTVMRQIMAAIFSRGHCLLVGVPGLAKTLIVRSLAETMALSFKRIQFTPDLMPSDITGTNVLEESEDRKREFRFVPGPIFAHIILADEINRTPPKTQAALLEAMQERQVTVGQTTYNLPEPFFVIATQNPIEQEGTYPLPEAQLDRFMFDIHVDYPSFEEEEDILMATTSGEAEEIRPVLAARTIRTFQRMVQRIVVSRHIVSYVARLVRATRPKDEAAPDFVQKLVDWGAGPRAGQHLILAAKAMAAMSGRVNVAIDDIHDVAVPVLRHRIAPNFQAQAEGVDSVAMVHKLLDVVSEPEVAKYTRQRSGTE